VAEVASRLSGKSEELSTLSNHAVARLEEVGDALGERAQEAMAISERTAARFKQTGEIMDAKAEEASEKSEKIASRLDTAGDSLKQHMEHLSSTFEAAINRVNALSDLLALRSSEVDGISDRAIGKVQAWDRSVRHTTDELSRAANTVSVQGNELTKTLGRQNLELASASRDAARLTEALKEHHDRIAGEDFLRTATLIQESLQSIAVDITRIMEIAITEDDWKRYTKGDKGVFVRKIVGYRDRSKLPNIKHKYEQDSDFRDYTNRFIAQFDDLLRRAAESDHGGTLGGTFLTADVGKLYMLLCRALERDLPGEGV